MTSRIGPVALLLVVAGLSVTATLAWRQWTRAAVVEAEQRLQAHQFLAVLPAQRYDNQPLATPLQLTAEQPTHSRITAAYRATLATIPTAVVLVSQVQAMPGQSIWSLPSIQMDG